QEWQSLVDEIGDARLADVRFSSAAARSENQAALVDALTAAFLRRTASEWEAALSRVGVGCAHVYDEGGMSAYSMSEASRGSGFGVEADDPMSGPLLRHNVPVEFSLRPGRLAPACAIGQHTRALLAELGYAEDEIRSLLARGVVSDLS